MKVIKKKDGKGTVDNTSFNPFEEQQNQKLPDPPLDIFNGEILKIINNVSEAKCIPQEMTLATLIALVSACIGRSRGITVNEQWREHAHLYMMLISEGGTGKSHAFKYIFKDLVRAEKISKIQYKKDCRQYTEEMAAYRKSKDPNKELPKRPINIQYLLDNSTLKAAFERMEDNPKGLFWRLDEMSGFFRSVGKYNKSGNDGKRLLLSAFNAEKWNLSRKSKDGVSKERYIPNCSLGIFGTTQPDLLNSLFSYDDVEQGLPQSFLYIRAFVNKPISLRSEFLDSETSVIIERITKRLLSLEMDLDQAGGWQAKYLTLDSDAEKVFGHFSNLLCSQSFGTAKYEFIVKLVQMTLRIALILHHLEWASKKEQTHCPDTIGYKTMTSATKLVSWLIAHTDKACLFFPIAKGKSIVSNDTLVVERSLAKVIIDHEKDIIILEKRFVPNKTLYEWLLLAGYKYTKPAINNAALSLDMTKHRNGKYRGKIITLKSLEKCKRLLSSKKCEQFSEVMHTMCFPTAVGHTKVKNDTLVVERSIAKIVIENQEYIMSKDGFVSNKIFKTWLSEANCNYTNTVINNAIVKLDIEIDRKASDRGKLITLKSLEKCEQLLSSA